MRTLLLLVLALPTLPACGFLKSLAGKNSVDLADADVQTMSVDIRRQEKTICPREPVQMAVFLDVVLKGDKEKKSFETWQGKAGASKNDKLEFSDFAFHSEMGAFDDDGWFTPTADLRATLDKELAIKTVFKKRPDKFTFDTTYKPAYDCITSAGKAGAKGEPGGAGSSGAAGRDGTLAAGTDPGGPGGEGEPGAPGSSGADGGDGPRITVFATMVRTPFYDKLVALRLAGDVDDFLLVPIDKPISIVATGGDGGSGGPGGSGGRGGRGGAGNPGGRGGNGGRGADGGSGGRGGKGGEVEVTYDARFPELASVLQVDVHGGRPGGAGGSGSGGDRGSGGGKIGQNAQSGGDGAAGPRGSTGRDGAKGPDGRSSVKSGSVTDRFAGIGGLTLLGDTAPSAPAPDPSAPGKTKDKVTPKKAPKK